MRKTLWFMLILFSAALAFANGGADDTAVDDPVSVDVYTWSSGDDTESKRLDAYNVQATDVVINPKYIPPADYESKIMTLLAGGMDMDVYMQKRQADMFPHYANGYIEPLNDLIEAHGFDYSTLSAWDSALTVDGEILGLPFRGGKYYTYYNEKPFRDKGLPTPQELVKQGEWTWEKFIEMSQAVSENDGQTYGSCFYTWGGQQVFPAHQRGIQFIDTDGNVDIDDSVLFSVKMRKTLEDGLDMVPLVDLKVTKTHYSQVMYTGQAHMLIIGEWFAGMMHDAFEEGKVTAMDEPDFRITRMPSNNPVYTTVGAPTFGHIYSGSKKKDAAFQVLSWFAGPEGAKAEASLGLLPPVTNDEVIRLIRQNIPDETSLEYFLEDVPVLPMHYTKYGTKVDLLLGRFTEMFLLGELSEDEFLPAMREELQTIADTTD